MAKLKRDKHKIWGLLLIAASIMVVVVPFFTVDLTINRGLFASRDFKNAFESRITGNCEEFMKYVLTDQNGWRAKCENEKRLATDPFYDFKIRKATVSGDQSFLQVELTRAGRTYPVTYEMFLLNGRWMINQQSGQ